MIKIDSVALFFNIVNQTSPVYIFGTGTYGDIVSRFCHFHDIHIEGVVVSSSEHEGYFNELKVFSLHEISELQEKDSCIVIAVAEWEDVYELLEENTSFNDICICSEQFMLELIKERWERSESVAALGCDMDIDYSGMEQDYALLKDKMTGKHLARIHCTTNFEDYKGEISLLERIKLQFGDLSYYKGTDEFGFERHHDDCAVFVVTGPWDKAFMKMDLPTGYKMVQAGAALSDENICELKDSTGDNISIENRLYSECSVHYWVWRNVKEYKYVGVNHYRRIQQIGDDIIERAINDNVDLILALPQFTVTPFKAFYMKYSTDEEWRALTYAIEKTDPMYLGVLDDFGAGNLYIPCNIMFGRKEAFDDYCSFMFSLTFAIREWYKENGLQERMRYMGYLTEIIENLYIMAHKDTLKIGYTDVYFVR